MEFLRCIIQSSQQGVPKLEGSCLFRNTIDLRRCVVDTFQVQHN